MGGADYPGVETIGAGGGVRHDPLLPCNDCGTKERFMAIKRSDLWSIEYLDDGSGQWVAYCTDCTDESDGDTDE